MLYGTFILAGANVLVRIIGFVYQIMLSRLLGPEGTGVYQLVFPPYTIALALTTSGIPIAVSRLVASSNAVGNYRQCKRIVLTALLIVIIVGLVLSILILTNLNWITNRILKDSRTHIPLFILFPCVIITGMGATLKGYFYGIKHTHQPALAEILEQLIRISSVGFLLLWLKPQGYEEAVIVIVFGVVIGELASLLYLHIRYHYSTKFIKTLGNNAKTSPFSLLLKNIISIAVPLTFTRIIITSINSINSILVPRRLAASGMTNSQAVSLFGIISGMVMPLLFIPFTITNALSTIIIPHLAEEMALGNWSSIRHNISSAIQLTSLVAFASTALLLSLGQPIGIALYAQPQVGQLLTPFTLGAIFLALQHTLSAVLNGLDRQKRSTLNLFIGGIIQVLCTYFLVSIPALRIYGFIIGFNLRNITVSMLNFSAVKKLTKLQIRWADWLFKPGFAALVMASLGRCVFNLSTHAGSSLIVSLTLAAAISAIFFLISLYSVNGIPRIKRQGSSLISTFMRSLRSLYH
ncbi:stage V sporulation protein B [Caldicoprobacter guelmensis]|uniref:stage V sporulation protein B n=1 Tax=Caldicoprobacter guelmensis TaxID=1170224 RepID=UPI0037445F91